MGRPIRDGDPQRQGVVLIFEETGIPGVVTVELEPVHDDRGFFARSFCEREFAEHGLVARFVQANVSSNPVRGTLRGMHYQAEPSPDPKLVRCPRGAIYDVAVDLRRDSPTFRRWVGRELGSDNQRALYVPAGCAHGFVTLADETDVAYLMAAPYDASLARGVRWDDPAFGIEWPLAPRVISERDASYPDFRP